MYTNVQETPQRPPYRSQSKRSMATLPEEKPPAAVSVMVPEADGKVTPYRVQIDPARSKIGQGAIATAGAASSVSNAVLAPGQTPEIAPTQPPPAPGPGPVDQVQDAYKTVVDTQSGALDKHQGRFHSMLESLFAGMADVGPIHDGRDLVGALAHIAATGVGGLVDKGMGQKLSRPYRVKIAEDRLKQAQSVATTTSTVQKRESDAAAKQSELDLKKKREERLTKAHDDIVSDREAKNLLSAAAKIDDFDPEDPSQADDPNSITSKLKAKGIYPGAHHKTERIPPSFTGAGGIKMVYDENGDVTVLRDKETGEAAIDGNYVRQVSAQKSVEKYRNSIIDIQKQRETRMTRAQAFREDQAVQKRTEVAAAHEEAARAFDKIAEEAQAALDSEQSPQLKRAYASQVNAAKQNAAKERGDAGMSSVDLEKRNQMKLNFESVLRGLKTEKEVRAWAKGQSKVTGKPVDDSAVEFAVNQWKALWNQ